VLASEIAASFPEADRHRLVSQSVTPGAILYLHCPFTTPPKDKYAVILSVGNPCLLFLLNSKINAFIAARPWMLKCQVALSIADYPFLRRDSCLNCAEVKSAFDRQDIIDQLAADTTRIKGALSPATRLTVRTAVQAARTIEPRYVREILQSLT
jgi:hypothetical protein